MPVNMDVLSADVPLDDYGFPVLPDVAPETVAGSTLAQMTNDYTHIRGRFWVKAMKMKQQKAIVRLAAKIQGVADPAMIMDTVTEMALQVVFVEESGEHMRPATADEIDDEFTADEMQKLTGDVTGIRFEGGDQGNAAPPTGG